MKQQFGPTRHLAVEGGRLAYDVAGEGPLIVLSPGMADTRAAYRFLAPLLVAAGYRVARVDLRGHGESSVDWPSYTHVDTAGDLLAVIRELGGPAVVVGQSFSGGAATIAAEVRCPTLIIMGSADSDFPNPVAEATALVGLLPAGLGSHRMIDGAGHYPHAEYPQQVAEAMVSFLTASRA